MTSRLRPYVLICGLLPVALTAALSLSRPLFLARYEYAVYDLLARAVPARPPAGRIVIVDVDERSLAVVGQWPWRRDVIGQLVTNLRNLGASTIALDMMFAERDRLERQGEASDEGFATVLRGGRVVLGYGLTFDAPAEGSTACVQHPLGLAVIRPGHAAVGEPLFRATGAVCSLPQLSAAAGASGFLNAAPDSDGLLRRVPLIMELDGQVYPSLSLAAVAAATGTRDIALRVANINTSTLIVGTMNVPLDGKSNLLLRYRGKKRAFPYVSALDVLRGSRDAARFKDALVFVGTTALGTREVVATPLDTLFAGVEVQATAADNLLQQDFIQRPEHAVALETQVLVALGLFAVLVVSRFGVGRGGVIAAACLPGIWVVAVRLLSTTGAVVSPIYPTLGVAGAIVAMTFAGLAAERRRADRAGRDGLTSRRLMVQALLSLTETRDAETGLHSRRTRRLVRALAEQLAMHPDFRDYLTRERIDLLSALAPLHDIGKVGVPDHLLNKPGKLTSDEVIEMRRHTAYGRDVILKTERDVGVHDDATLTMAKDIVYTHHEKWDGTGYPEGLRGQQIPIAGRLMAVVDVFDAITSRRLYHTPMSRADAIAFIVRGSGSHFDPAVVSAFVALPATLHDELDAANLAALPEAGSIDPGGKTPIDHDDLLPEFDVPKARVSPWRVGRL